MTDDPVGRSLSPREKQLMELLIGTSEDMANIAYRMGITYGTAKVYSASIYQKSGASGRIELMSREIHKLKAVRYE